MKDEDLNAIANYKFLRQKKKNAVIAPTFPRASASAELSTSPTTTTSAFSFPTSGDRTTTTFVLLLTPPNNKAGQRSPITAADQPLQRRPLRQRRQPQSPENVNPSIRRRGCATVVGICRGVRARCRGAGYISRSRLTWQIRCFDIVGPDEVGT